MIGRIIVSVGFWLLAAAASPPANAQYYYSGGGTIPLRIDSTRIVVGFDESVGPQNGESILAAIPRVSGVLVDDHTIDDMIACGLSSGYGYGEFLDSLRGIDGIYCVEPYYLDEFDSSAVVGLTFCVAFVESLNRLEIDSINQSFRVVIDHTIEGMPNVFVLRNTDSSGYQLLDIANEYFGLPETRYAHPEFGLWIQPQSNQLYDHYNDYQPHTKKVIGEFNVASVWDFA